MRTLTRVMTATLVPLITAALFNPAGAQETMSQVDDFDPDRAILNDAQWFDPFRPTELGSLAAALREGKVEEATPLMVLERNGDHLAVSTMQMSYHHVAQGELAGEPWMVSF